MFLVHENRSKRVLKYGASFVGAYAMLPMISPGFLGVPFEHQKHYATSLSYGTGRAIPTPEGLHVADLIVEYHSESEQHSSERRPSCFTWLPPWLGIAPRTQPDNRDVSTHRYTVYSPMACFTLLTVSRAMGVTRSAPLASTWPTKPGSAMISR